MAYLSHGLTMLDAVALMALVGLLQVRLHERMSENSLRSFMGLLCGLVSLTQLAHPMELQPGVIVDLRNVPVALAGAFFGLRGMVIAVAMAVSMRMHLGGAGVPAGVLGICVAGTAGLVWNHFTARLPRRGMMHLATLGAGISAHMSAAMLLPASAQGTFLIEVAPILALLNMLSALTAGYLLEQARRDCDDVKRLRASALSDPQTGLLNPAGLRQSASAAMRDRAIPASIAAIQIQLTDGDWMRSRHGQEDWSAIMAQIGYRLSGRLRIDDLAGRTADHRLTILLFGIDSAGLDTLCRDLQRLLTLTSYQSGGRELGRIRMTIGAGLHTRGIFLRDVLETSELALGDAAKSRGYAIRIEDHRDTRTLFDVADALIASRSEKHRDATFADMDPI